MTRKDYVLLAQALNDAWLGAQTQQGRSYTYVAAKYLALYLKKDNPHFDEDIFLDAVCKARQ